MGLTEKQGGSDVRADTTTAAPVGQGGRGGEYSLRGHKWFFSAPLWDAHLVVARADDADAFGCFYVPRFRPDGSKNAIHIQRLKNKLGNVGGTFVRPLKSTLPRSTMRWSTPPPTLN
jgi:putative acyl-CoA dehydrogenase